MPALLVSTSFRAGQMWSVRGRLTKRARTGILPKAGMVSGARNPALAVWRYSKGYGRGNSLRKSSGESLGMILTVVG